MATGLNQGVVQPSILVTPSPALNTLPIVPPKHHPTYGRFVDHAGMFLSSAGCSAHSVPTIGQPPPPVRNECHDGIDNDGDGYADVNGGKDGEPEDEKCRALNEPQEALHLKLSSSAMVGPEGGFLVLGDLRVKIPEGALGKKTKITVERIPGMAPDQLSYKDDYVLKPEGLEFLEPVTIGFVMSAKEQDRPEKLWLYVVSHGKRTALDSTASLKTDDSFYYLVGALDSAQRISRGFGEPWKVGGQLSWPSNEDEDQEE